MRYEGDIRRNKWKSICYAALLNDNAPDSELYQQGFESTGDQKFLISTQ